MNITRTAGDNTALISGSVGYYGIHFNFDAEFADLAGLKAVEFYKNRNKIRIDLVDGACAIPNELLKDNQKFEIRVISGTMIATTWTPVSIIESGVIFPEEPEEETILGTEYVKSVSGENAVALLRSGYNGLEYSTDGEDWNSGVSGVPEVPAKPKDAEYLRKNGDWVQFDPSRYASKNEVEALQVLTGTATQLTTLDYGETDTTVIVSKINEIITQLQTRGVSTV